MKRLIAIFALLAAASVRGETYAITDATIYTSGPAGKIDHGTVVIRDGKIAAVGASVAVPAGAIRVDAAGKVVTPGLFDPKSRFGIEEVTAAVDVASAINPRSMLIPVNRVAGVTTAAVAPSVTTGGTIVAGRGAVMTLGSLDHYLLKDPAAMFVTLGETGAELAGGYGVSVREGHRRSVNHTCAAFAREPGRPILLIAAEGHLCLRAPAVGDAISIRLPR